MSTHSVPLVAGLPERAGRAHNHGGRPGTPSEQFLLGSHPDTLVASTAGLATSLPPWMRAFQPDRILCAYDADPPGDQAAALQRQLPNCQRLRPVAAKDWNQLLLLSTAAAL